MTRAGDWGDTGSREHFPRGLGSLKGLKLSTSKEEYNLLKDKSGSHNCGEKSEKDQ